MRKNLLKVQFWDLLKPKNWCGTILWNFYIVEKKIHSERYFDGKFFHLRACQKFLGSKSYKKKFSFSLKPAIFWNRTNLLIFILGLNKIRCSEKYLFELTGTTRVIISLSEKKKCYIFVSFLTNFWKISSVKKKLRKVPLRKQIYSKRKFGSTKWLKVWKSLKIFFQISRYKFLG